MEEILRDHLIRLATFYSKETGTALTAIGSRSLNYSYFFDRIRDPKISLTLRTYDKVVGWFSANWPKELMWPADIPRPTAVEEQVA